MMAAPLENCAVRKIFVSLLAVAPLLAGCGKAEEPLIPELKGRWDMLSNFSAAIAVRVAGPAQPVPQPARGDRCAVSYVTFAKSGIHIQAFGMRHPVFQVSGTKREGQLLTLTGRISPVTPEGKLVLLVRKDEVRFDDVFDETGRSIKYERVPDDNPARRFGATTLGEAMQLILDLKPCKT